MDARLLLVDLWMDPTRTQPPAAPLMSGEFLVHSGEGQSYGEDEANDWLAQTVAQARTPIAGGPSERDYRRSDVIRRARQ
jgi:hypothetical protein